LLWNMDCWPDTAERLKMIRPNGLLSHAMRWGNRLLLCEVDHIVCLDESMADLVLSQYATPGRTPPCTIIPNWERVKDFPKMERPIRKNNEFVILYLGNAGYGHEFQTVLDAASLLGGEQVQFRFVGGGSQYAWIANEAAERGLKNFSLNPYIPKEQTPGVMRQAHCALITLENYALGVMSPSKLHANLACGLPIIYVGPEGSNVDRAIRDYSCGISIRPGNSAMLADAIKSLTADQNNLTKLQDNARDAFEAAYCDAKTLPLFDEVLEKMHHVKVR
jgi:colanic acid biosynthesis glycosyl transferase WcaI